MNSLFFSLSLFKVIRKKKEIQKHTLVAERFETRNSFLINLCDICLFSLIKTSSLHKIRFTFLARERVYSTLYVKVMAMAQHHLSSRPWDIVLQTTHGCCQWPGPNFTIYYIYIDNPYSLFLCFSTVLTFFFFLV